MELEDLRDEPLAWKFHTFHRSECEILLGARPIGRLQRLGFWKNGYRARLAGLDWQIETRLTLTAMSRQLGVGDGDFGLGEAVRRKGVYGARIDGVPYVLTRSCGARAVWRDELGLAVVSFTLSANTQGEFRMHQGGAVHVFQACPTPHAPPLVLLGLVEIVHGGFFSSDTSALIAADGIGQTIGSLFGS